MTEFFEGNGASIVSSLLGLAGSIALVWSAWRTLRIRQRVLGVEAIRPKDSTMIEVVSIVSRDLNEKQMRMIRWERFSYGLGVLLLVGSFLVSLLDDLI